MATTQTNAREAILARIRAHLGKRLDESVLEPAHPSDAPAYALPAPGTTPAARFAAALEKVGGHPHRAQNGAEARRILLNLVAERKVQRAILLDAPLLHDLEILSALQQAGVEVLTIAAGDGPAGDLSAAERANLRAAATAADLCISSADYAIAESGTLVLPARRGFPRAAPVLPPAHVALVRESQIVPHLEGLIPQLKAALKGNGSRWGTSCLMFTTGPSRTADIEQTLTIGVHGPGDMDVILVADQNPED
ncbi:MAG: lactate utilization protein [Anaerolineae bacterium]|nr:lactate utilization protein [Anaerolineae bacterium]